MSDRLAWIRAQLDATEAAAKAATPGPWVVSGTGTYVDVVDGNDRCIAVDAEVGACLPRDAAHIRLHDQAAVLTDVEAKRAILDMYQALVEDFTHVDETVREHARREVLEDVVGRLAEGFRGRPGYEEAMRDGADS